MSASYNHSKQHKRKRVYRSKTRAWFTILRIWTAERSIDSLEPYECYWTDLLADGKSGPRHIHIGHNRYNRRAKLREMYKLWTMKPPVRY